ncbi:hypothetical protein SELMODRAFT_421109 [Selaginella moellendorffii]|uniref:Lactate/malate dehydrogenase C-terminal domain-containing protein n=1 Tax=Selaginella moellendorffii TaxID=88036 RepID=D8SE66_SELML|nr:hypothetical protein SELMODRAFT_421109 [Selaginella moellendorffii]
MRFTALINQKCHVKNKDLDGIYVFDRDTFSEDDTMGDVSVDLQPLYAAVKAQEAMGDELGNVQSQASALEKCAAKDVKVLVVANPAKTNALILKNFAPSIPDKNITCLTKLDHNRVLGQISKSTWTLNGPFVSTIQHCGAAIIKERKLSSALSTASSAYDHICDWVLGIPKGTWVSMGVLSDGSYKVPKGVIYSLLTCANWEWSIVQGLSIDGFSRT